MANVKDLLVNGSARVIGTIYGNATSANKVNYSLTFGSKSFNGSSAQTITLADLGGKPTQSAVSSPSASGTEISFIDTISQNANGVITATKKTVRDASASQSGIVNTEVQSFAGDKTFTGQLIKSGVSTSWVNGRENAFLRMSSINGYSPAISIKTTNGSWDLGAYNASSYTDDLIFSYVTDANYNSGNNTTTAEIKFLENGHIVASLDGNAATATNADKLDNKHANEFIYFSYDTGLGNGSPADIAKSYFLNDDKTPRGMLKGYYNHNGVEYSQLFSRASSGTYGSILKWGYNDRYMRILRYRNGWLSEDWEKMDAGNADTATKLATARNITIGNKTNSFNGSADITYNLQDILIRAGNEFNYTADGIVDLWFNYKTQTGTNSTTKITDYYFANGQSGTDGVTIHASNFSGNAATASKVNNKLTVGSKNYDGSAAVTIAASDLGLSSAMLFLGTTTTAITDGATTNPVAIGGSNKTVTAGNVVLYGSKEFVWTGSVWEELGNEGSYKIVQSAVADPSASGTSNTFIATISQDTNGKITATKKTVAVTNNAPTLAWGTTSTIGTVAGTNLQVTMPANPNTWRGIQNNLTSDSTTDSLSAAQGKALKALIDGKAASSHTHDYLPLSGGTLTGKVYSNIRNVKLPSGDEPAHFIGNLHCCADKGSGSAITDGYVSAITFGDSTTTAYAGIYSPSSHQYGNYLMFATTDSYTDGAKTRMVIDHVGRVGIGTTTPNYTLHVNGTSYLNGNTTINDSLTVSNIATFNNSLRIGNNANGDTNYIAFYGTSGDNPGGFDHTYIGENLWGSSESSELVLFKGNDIAPTASAINGPGPDRIRHIAAGHLFQVYTSALNGSFTEICDSTVPIDKFEINQYGAKIYGDLTVTGTMIGNADRLDGYHFSDLEARYLVKTGDTITGNILIAPGGAGGVINGSATNGGLNSILIGDDVWLGDCNVGGTLGLKSNNTASAGFSFFGIDGTNYGRIYYDSSGGHSTSAFYGAVWNDYAEYRQSDTTQPGRCIIENGDDTLSLSTARLQKGAEIVSDTFGFAIGETDDCKTPIACSGRVLAYPYESREEFKKHIGDCVCSGPNGTVSIMTPEEEKEYPSCIIGTISAVPNYEKWGSGEVDVSGRVWIRIR